MHAARHLEASQALAAEGVQFVDDKLARWEGDEMPASVAELNKAASAKTAGEEEWNDPRSWWDKLTEIFRR